MFPGLVVGIISSACCWRPRFERHAIAQKLRHNPKHCLAGLAPLRGEVFVNLLVELENTGFLFWLGWSPATMGLPSSGENGVHLKESV